MSYDGQTAGHFLSSYLQGIGYVFQIGFLFLLQVEEPLLRTL